MGITPQPSVGLCGDTHLERCSQELNQLMKFHFSDYNTDLERWNLDLVTALSRTVRWLGRKQYGLNQQVSNQQVHIQASLNASTSLLQLRWAT